MDSSGRVNSGIASNKDRTAAAFSIWWKPLIFGLLSINLSLVNPNQLHFLPDNWIKLKSLSRLINIASSSIACLIIAFGN